MDALVVLARRRTLVLGLSVAAGMIAAGVSFLIPNSYTATEKILPPQQAQSTAAAMLSQLGGIAGMAGNSLGLKTPADLYIGMMKSNTVADALITRFDLKRLYRAKFQDQARKDLWDATHFATDKAGIISIHVEARTPQLAATLASAYTEELYKLTSTLATTEAAQRRIFFQRQLEKASHDLAESEVKLRSAIESGGLVSVDAQSRAIVETIARLRAQISVKQVQIGSISAYATADNPDLRRAEQELASLRQELSRLESGPRGSIADGPDDAHGVANIRLVRNVKYHEVLFELLAKQYEFARADEAREAPLIQILDRATPPERKSSPSRVLLTILGFLVGLVLAAAGAIGAHLFGEIRNDPESNARLMALRTAWGQSRRNPPVDADGGVA